MRNPKAKVIDPNKFVTCPGDTVKIEYSAKILENGNILLKESGKTDIKAMINSFREQTDMAYILKQLMLGDTSVLRSDAMYGDFTMMPSSMIDAMQLMLDGERAFYELDLETRQKFDNNYRQWLIDAGSEQWFSKMGLGKKESVQSQPEESNKEGDKVQSPG